MRAPTAIGPSPILRLDCLIEQPYGETGACSAQKKAFY